MSDSIQKEVKTTPINKGELSAEMIKKAMECKTADELTAAYWFSDNLSVKEKRR